MVQTRTPLLLIYFLQFFENDGPYIKYTPLRTLKSGLLHNVAFEYKKKIMHKKLLRITRFLILNNFFIEAFFEIRFCSSLFPLGQCRDLFYC